MVVFQRGSLYVALAGLEHTVCIMLAPDSEICLFHLLSAGIKGLHQYFLFNPLNIKRLKAQHLKFFSLRQTKH